MSFLVLAYPTLSSSDFNYLQNYRLYNDELYFKVVKPHFTLVFPIVNFTLEEFTKEVKEKSILLKKVNFTIRCATINKDAFSDYYHTLLVPDEGYSNIVKMHDHLYSGIFNNQLRLDIDFIPHIGVGNSKNKFICKQSVDEWNRKDFSIEGSITHLTMVKYENEMVTDIDSFSLL